MVRSYATRAEALEVVRSLNGGITKVLEAKIDKLIKYIDKDGD